MKALWAFLCQAFACPVSGYYCDPDFMDADPEGKRTGGCRGAWSESAQLVDCRAGRGHFENKELSVYFLRVLRCYPHIADISTCHFLPVQESRFGSLMTLCLFLLCDLGQVTLLLHLSICKMGVMRILVLSWDLIRGYM